MKHLYRAVGQFFLTGCLLFMSGCGGPVAADQIDKVEHPRLNIMTDNGTVEVRVEIADTFEERRKGLMFRTELPDKQGMYFVFEESKILDFWMKNTLVPLDMIFIDDNYKIVNIVENTPPCKEEQCPTYSSTRAAHYVLEIRGGQSDALGIQPGDSVQLAI